MLAHTKRCEAPVTELKYYKNHTLTHHSTSVQVFERIGTLKRRCSLKEFWLHAKSSMHESMVWGLNSAAPSAHISDIDFVIHSTLEPRVLLLRQKQEHPTPAHCDPLFQHHTALLVREAAPRSTNSMILSGEVKCRRLGSGVFKSASRNWDFHGNIPTKQ